MIVIDDMSELSQEEKCKVVQNIIANTDWEAFWDGVTKACEPEIEAYRRASADSYAKSHEHWFV